MFARLTPLLLLAGCVAPQPPVPPASAATLAQARTLAFAPAEWAATCTDWDEWEKPAPAFRIHGDTYHVGTCGISAILVTGPHGSVLLDTGTRDGSSEVLTNIRNLGFHQENVRAILTSHEHYDHVGGLYWVAQNTGALIYASSPAAQALEAGAARPDNPQYALGDRMRPVPADFIREVTPGQPLTLAGLAFTPIATPGHTPGALSWQWQSCEESACVSIVYADSLTPVSSDEYRFSDHPDYVQAFRASLARLAALECDILLTPHPSASGMRDKALAGDFAAGEGCAAYAARLVSRLEARLAEEATNGG